MFFLPAIELEGRRESKEFEVGARLVELSLDGQPTEIALEAVPAGTYTELGLELMRADGNDFPEFEGQPASVLVSGTYNGDAFTYRSAAAPEMEFDVVADVHAGQTTRIGITI